MRSFIIVVVFSSVALADSKKEVTVATLTDYAPFCFSEKNVHNIEMIKPGQDSKTLKGYSWEILRESYHHMGYTIILHTYPWIRALNTVRRGKVEVLFPTGKNSEREKIFNYSKENVNNAKFIIYINQDSPIVWKDLKSLKGLRIAIKRGFNYGQKFNNNNSFNKISVQTIEQGLNMLRANRVHGFAGYEFNWDYVIKTKNIKGNFKKLPPFDSSSEYLVGLKSNKWIIQILNDFDKGKQLIDQLGITEKIQNKWFKAE